MQLNCPSCDHPFSIAGNAPKFCSNCGEPLTDFITSHSGTIQAGDVTLPPKPLTRVANIDDETVGPGGRTSSADSDAQASQIGPYALIKKLGQGGMGSVYEAVNENTGQRVALKLLSRSLVTTEESVERFRRESQIAANINHPRSTFVYEAGHHDGQFYITMELMPGGTLKEVVEEEGQLDIGRAVDYILDIIDGLQVAHEAGIVHRDLKPTNSFVDYNGRVKIGDFGLARSFVADSSLTQTGTFMGTPQFAAPEQLRASEVDERADIYAIGGTLFYLLTERPPFMGNAASVIASIATDIPPLVTKYRKDTPKALARLIAQTLEKDPAKRPENLTELRMALAPYSSRGASLADFGRRLAAFFMDGSIASIVSVISVQILTVFLISSSIQGISFQTMTIVSLIIQTLIAVSYFAIAEWRYGKTLGKWLMGLRVINDSGETPGLIPAYFRAMLIPGLSWIFGSLPNFFFDITGGDNGLSIKDLIYFTALGYAFSLIAWVPSIILLSTARAANGFRGLHDTFTGTRVVSLGGALQTRRMQYIPITAPTITDESPLYGNYRAIARYNHAESKYALYLGRDAELDRTVWIHCGEDGLGKYEGDRKSLTRPYRVRVLAEGNEQGGWQATESVLGVPLVDVFSKRKNCDWQSARHSFLDLANEFTEAIEDHTVPNVLSLSQVWVDYSGRLKLLDKPVYRPSDDPNSEVLLEHADPTERAAALFIQLFDRYSQGQALPMHAIEFRREFEQRLSEPDSKSELFSWTGRTLAEFADRAGNWKWDDRLGLLTVSFGSELPIYMAGLVALGLLAISMTKFIAPGLLGFLLFAIGSLVAFATGYFFDGGLAMKLSGIQVCRRGIKRACSKLRCGMRNLVVWTPFIAMATLLIVVVNSSIVEAGIDIEATPANTTVEDSTAAFWFLLTIPIGFLVMACTVYALIRPARSVPDLLVGTELIRK